MLPMDSMIAIHFYLLIFGMAGEKLKQEDCVKYLGVYFDDQLITME